MSKPMRIYIAGALSSKEDGKRNPSKVVTDYITNVHKMCKAASIVRKKGHYPFIPCLDFLVGVIAGDWDEEDYRGGSDEFLVVCDAILILSLSYGVRRELALATKLGIIIYDDIDKIPDISDASKDAAEDLLEGVRRG
jgi:hypothetical protein